jgi:hypothetical protein
MEIKINLLPPYRKEEILQGKRIRTVVKLEGLVFFVAVIFFGFLVSFAYILKLDFYSVPDDSNSKNNHDQYEKIKNYDDEFSKINLQLASAIKMKKDQLYWSILLEKLSEKTPEGIEISNLSTKNYAVFLAGKAGNRDSLLSFKGNLEKEGCFTDVNLPLSNLVSKENIDFQMDLKIKEDCIKSQ